LISLNHAFSGKVMGRKENIDLLNGTLFADQEGLEIDVLQIKNKCLLSKWLYKLQTDEGVWQELLRNKYLHSKSLSEVTVKPNDSPFWKGFMKVKEKFLSKGFFKVGNGKDTRF
jgi:hypothetical protein